MKKIILAILLTFSSLSLFCIAPKAINEQIVSLSDNGARIIYFEDGSSLVISAPQIISAERDAYDKSRTIINTHISSKHYDSNNNLEWEYILYTTFSYEYGVSSVCTNASYTQTIYKGNWTFSNGSTSISGNRGNGTGLFTEKFLFITIQNINVSLTMACDIYGNVTA